MPVQLWIQTRKENVQMIRLILEKAGQLNKAQKVKPGQQDGHMIIPTNTYRDEKVEHEAGYFQTLSDLHLRDASQYSTVEIVYLPTPSPAPDTTEPKVGPIQEAISEWLQSLPEKMEGSTGSTRTDLLESSPRRWSIYEPMLLLPSGSFQDAVWKALVESVGETHLSSLWKRILHTVWRKEGGKELTHLAINSGIPSTQDTHSNIPHKQDSSPLRANILRTPSGLILLHGAFGPAIAPTAAPTAADLGAAFWVSSKQNGIVQAWAPRHTMFSRGNVKEKARLLGFHGPGRKARAPLDERSTAVAADLYAGIGYFAFSYAAAGFGRVLCWEINPWSVEGLRRGCVRNGWTCRVVRGAELEEPVQEVLRGGAKVVVFEEGNERAAGRMEAVRHWEEQERTKLLGDVLHVNCGFLPSSEASWETAWKIVCKSRHAWLHLHENVGVDDVQSRRKEIEGKIRKWALEDGASQIVDVEHVEPVKTFAPGVWHCVFDLRIQAALVNDS